MATTEKPLKNGTEVTITRRKKNSDGTWLHYKQPGRIDGRDEDPRGFLMYSINIAPRGQNREIHRRSRGGITVKT